MTLHLKSRGYPFRPRVLFSSFIVVGVACPTVYYFRRGQIFKSLQRDEMTPTEGRNKTSEEMNDVHVKNKNSHVEICCFPCDCRIRD